MGKQTRTFNSSEEMKAAVNTYVANGFKVKSESDTNVLLVKKTKGKRFSLTKGKLWIFWLLPKLVLLCCTVFTFPFIYNALHAKKEKVELKVK